jgi:DNA-binding NarL/FixJ family response regulator
MAGQKKHLLVILEDRLLLCDGIKNWICDEENYEVICQTGDWEECKKMSSSLNEIIIITTLQYIRDNIGLKECSDYLNIHPSIHVICLNQDSRDIFSLKLFESKISGIISLTAKKEEFLFGLENVANGRFYISTVMNRNIPICHHPKEQYHSTETISLTARESEILNLISLGFNDKEIGGHLNLSKRTVDGYRNTLLFKFNVRNTAQLIRYAIEKKYLS